MTRKITAVIARPIKGSARSKPIATTAAEATTPSDTYPSTRAWCPSAMQCRAVEPPAGTQANTGREFVAGEPDEACERECSEVVELAGIDQAIDRLVGGDARGDEDRRDHGISRPTFASLAAKDEGDAERDRGQCVADVVDEVREQCDGVGHDEHESLERSGCGEDRQAPRDRLDARPRANDRRVDESVRMSVIVVVIVVVMVGVFV